MFFRDIAFFAKRHRFVELDDSQLDAAEQISIQFFPDTNVVLKRRRLINAAGTQVWEGEIVAPIVDRRFYSFPDKEPLPEQLAKEMLSASRTVRITSMPVPSSVTGNFNFRRSVSVEATVPALGATYSIRPLPDNPLVHVAYEVDPEKCCFAIVDGTPVVRTEKDSRRIALGQEYKAFLESHGISIDDFSQSGITEGSTKKELE